MTLGVLTTEDVYVRRLAPDVGVWVCGDVEGGHGGGLEFRVECII